MESMGSGNVWNPDVPGVHTTQQHTQSRETETWEKLDISSVLYHKATNTYSTESIFPVWSKSDVPEFVTGKQPRKAAMGA